MKRGAMRLNYLDHGTQSASAEVRPSALTKATPRAAGPSVIANSTSAINSDLPLYRHQLTMRRASHDGVVLYDSVLLVYSRKRFRQGIIYNKNFEKDQTVKISPSVELRKGSGLVGKATSRSYQCIRTRAARQEPCRLPRQRPLNSIKYFDYLTVFEKMRAIHLGMKLCSKL